MSIYKRKDSSCYWVKIVINGQTVQRSTGTSDKAQAQEFHDRLKTSMWEQGRLGLKPRHSWKEAVIRWLDETSDKATHKEDIRKLIWLDSILGEKMLDEITLLVIDEIRAAKLKEASKATTNRYLALVRSILIRSRDEWEWIEKAPKVRLFKEIGNRERSLTKEQAQALVDELPEHQSEVVLFALATGLRQGKVLRLEWSQINLEQRHAWIRAAESKNRRPIAVPLNETAYGVLVRQLGKHPERVFTYKGEPLRSANNTAWRAALRRCEIKDLRWHDLRHTWATWQRQAGTPTHELQRLGGWQTASMVERYAHLGVDSLGAAAARVDSLMPSYDLATLATK